MAEAEIDQHCIRLKIWAPHLDEFVILTPERARIVAEDMLAKVEQIEAAMGRKE